MYNFKVDWFRCLELHLSQIKNENWLFKIEQCLWFQFLLRFKAKYSWRQCPHSFIWLEGEVRQSVCRRECAAAERALTHRSHGELQHPLDTSPRKHISSLLSSSSQERPPFCAVVDKTSGVIPTLSLSCTLHIQPTHLQVHPRPCSPNRSQIQPPPPAPLSLLSQPVSLYTGIVSASCLVCYNPLWRRTQRDFLLNTNSIMQSSA